MPSAEETTYLIESAMPETTQDFLSRDMDLLVSQIKENLRLSSLKAKSSVIQLNRANRALPYRISSRSLADPNCEMCCNKNNNNNSAHHDHRHHHHHHYQKRAKERDEDDPYELLQELLREGGLIKEAVKRLQAINIEELANNSTEEDEEDEEDEEEEDEEEDIEDVENNEPSTRISTRRRTTTTTTTTYRRKPYFYDSEDEVALPQVYQSLEL